MQTVPFGKLGFDVSRLGFGMMRLPTYEVEEGRRAIDRPEAIRMLRHAIDSGVNYVDTAYGYHDGESEILTGIALKDGYREKVKLTSKLPQWLVNTYEDMDRLLDEQMKKLDVPYLDFYLLHALNREAFHKLQKLDYKRFLKQAQKDGRVRHIGFSFHDDQECFKEIIDDHHWDLAQIQLNYLDDEAQATVEGMRYAGARGIPVVVMEPLRGGGIAQPPKEIADMMRENPRGWSPIEWAFRYVGDFPEVVTILSGMSTFEQVAQNLDIFSRVAVGSLTEADKAFVAQLKKAYMARIGIGCTQCNYCQPCPEGVLIPRIFEAYNTAYMLEQYGHLSFHYGNINKDKGDASLCVACGQCEAACPQQLPIIQLLHLVHNKS